MPYDPTLNQRGNNAHLVDKVIGNSYWIVREVYKNLPFIRYVTDKIDNMNLANVEFRGNDMDNVLEWKYENETDWKVLITYADLIEGPLSEAIEPITTLIDQVVVELSNLATAVSSAETSAASANAAADRVDLGDLDLAVASSAASAAAALASENSAEADADRAEAAASSIGSSVIKFAADKALGDTAAVGALDGSFVIVNKDETRGGIKARYRVESDALVFVTELTADQVGYTPDGESASDVKTALDSLGTSAIDLAGRVEALEADTTDFATPAETILGEAEDKATTPAGVKAALDAKATGSSMVKLQPLGLGRQPQNTYAYGMYMIPLLGDDGYIWATGMASDHALLRAPLNTIDTEADPAVYEGTKGLRRIPFYPGEPIVRAAQSTYGALFAITESGKLYVVGGTDKDYHAACGPSVHRIVPTDPLLLATDVVDIKTSVGGSAAAGTLVLKTDGTLWYCGINNYGQNGNGTTSVSAQTLTQVDPPYVGGLWADMYVCSGYCLGVDTNGKLYYWGVFSFSGTDLSSTVPVAFTKSTSGDLDDVVRVMPFSIGTVYALTSTGELWGVGRNNNGQLGTGDATNLATAVLIDTGVVDFTTNYRTVHWIKDDGTVWGTGLNGHGTLGNGSTTESLVKVQATGITDAVKIWAPLGTIQTDATVIKRSGSNALWSVGDGNRGQNLNSLGSEESNVSPATYSPIMSGRDLGPTDPVHNYTIDAEHIIWFGGWLGSNSVLVITTENKLLGMGGNSYGLFDPAQSGTLVGLIPVPDSNRYL